MTTNITPAIRRELGARRAAVAYIIKHELGRRGYSGVSLARQLGISDTYVSRVINGRDHGFAVLDALREIGIPEKYLFDPRRAEPPKGVKEEQEAPREEVA